MSEEQDFLEVDPQVRGQNYCCISFVSPEEVLKNKEIFFIQKFLSNIQSRYNALEELLHKHITDDDRKRHEVVEFKMSDNELQNRYKDFMYVNQEKLDEEFYENNNFRTTMRGVKIRGVYDTEAEAKIKAKKLQQLDKNFNVYIGQVGYWLPWDPNPLKIDHQEYAEKELNTLVKEYKENQDKKDIHFKENIEYAREQSKNTNQLLKENELSVDNDKIVNKTGIEDEDPWIQRKRENDNNE